MRVRVAEWSHGFVRRRIVRQESLSDAQTADCLIVGVVVVGQERKRADVDRLDAFEEVAVAHGFIVALPGNSM